MTLATPLAVTGLGMVTSLGLDAVSSCAAARAGLAFPTPIEHLDVAGEGVFGSEGIGGPPAIFGHHVRGVADTYSGFARLALLAEAALAEALGARNLSPSEAAAAALALCAPRRFAEDPERAEGVEGESLRRAERLGERLARHEAWAARPRRCSVRLGGSAAFAAAVEDAAAQLASGSARVVVIGAVDSRVDPAPVRALASLGQLRTNDNPAGAMPGEAAAFVVVEALAATSSPLAVIDRCAAVRAEASLLDPERAPSGVELAAAIRAAAGPGRLDWVIADVNGTSRRAIEWGNAISRMRESFGDAGPTTWAPARSFGDVGAAAGPVGVCVAARAFARRYAAASASVVSLSSEDGEKGAILVRAGG